MTDTSLLWLATFVLALAFLTPLGAMKLPVLLRPVWRVGLLIVLTYLVLKLSGSPVQPRFHSEPSGQELWEQLILAGWWALVARSAVSVARMLVVLQERSREAQIIVDLVAGAIYLAAGVAVITLVFAFPLGGLLATSGILAIVLGLALQSTLSDVFSGIAVGIERPFKAGDVVWVEGGVEGTILQINWRSTHIATGSDHITIIPNSVIAKSRVINHSRPTTIRMDKVEIRLDPAAAAKRCLSSLTSAVRACRLPLDKPSPLVVQKSLDGDGATYEIHFAVSDSDTMSAAKTEIFGEIQRHLRHDGISLAVRGLSQVAPTPVPTVANLLEHSDLFGGMAKDGREVLAGRLTDIHISTGAHLITQDQPADALFVIASGTVEVSHRESHRPILIRRMGPGATLGAIGLITGAPYAASAIALTPVKAYRLDKKGIQLALAARPELSAELEDMARRGQAALAQDVAATDEHKREQPEMLLSRVRHFIQRLSEDTAA